MIGRDLGERTHIEDLSRGEVMDVLMLVERGAHRLVTRKMRHEPQLDLAVIGRDQHAVLGRSDEGAPHLPAQIAAHRDVLKVRIRRREPSGRGDRLIENRVNTAVVVGEPGKNVDVGVLELGDFTVIEDVPGDRVDPRERLQHFDARCVAGLILFPVREPEFFEEDPAELLRRADVELLARLAVDLFL